METNWLQIERRHSWERIQSLVAQKFKDPGLRWIFRGQRKATWELKSSLEHVAKDQFGLPLQSHAYIEWRLKREFSRNLHRFVGHIPRNDDYIEWLALMQHHGAPTRLLDWTYSFYVALFFAIEHAVPGETCAVWAIDQRWLVDTLRRRKDSAVRRAFKIDKSLKAPKAVAALLTTKRPLVVCLRPYRINERLAVQQGVFLVPMNLDYSFMENLRAMATPRVLRQHVLKIEIAVTTENQWRILAWLNRLNVNRLSLFPGIDGFASSLQGMVSWTRWPPADWRQRRAAEAKGNQPP